MAGIPSPFSGSPSRASTESFDAYDRFVPAGVPDPGPFLAGQAVLAGTEHAAFHRLTRRLFDERGVYDVTFGYNLARLNLDRRHPGAGYRYAVETGGDEGPRDDAPVQADGQGREDAPPVQADGQGREDAPPVQADGQGREDAPPAGDGAPGRVLRAEFTPTTPFCPQSKALTMGSYRAWNGGADRHEYDLVRVRVHPMHHRSESINAALSDLEPDGVASAAPDDEFESESDQDHGRILRDRLDEERDTEQADGVDLSSPF